MILPHYCCGSKTFMFADDAKLYKHVNDNLDATALLHDCQKLYSWCEQWMMALNTNKCKVLSIGRKVKTYLKYGFDIPRLGFVQLECVDSIKDLGVTFDSDMSFKSHIYEKINMAYRMLGIINRNFKHVDKRSFVLLYKSLVRSQLEYAQSVWSPFKGIFIKDLEKVQKRATKLVAGCKSLSYVERLQRLKLPTLKYRRIRCDMIEAYKILSGKYDSLVSPRLSLSTNSRTRGNSLKLNVQRTKYDIRKYCFSVRISNVWNSLPDEVILSDSVNSFKNNLDKFCKHEEIVYNYEADLSVSV